MHVTGASMECFYSVTKGNIMKVSFEQVVVITLMSMIILISLPEVEITGGIIFIFGLASGLMGLGAAILSIWCEICECMEE